MWDFGTCLVGVEVLGWHAGWCVCNCSAVFFFGPRKVKKLLMEIAGFR